MSIKFQLESNVTSLSRRRLAVASVAFSAEMLSVWILDLSAIVSLGCLLILLIALEPVFISRPMRYVWLGAVLIFLLSFLSFLLLLLSSYLPKW